MASSRREREKPAMDMRWILKMNLSITEKLIRVWWVPQELWSLPGSSSH